MVNSQTEKGSERKLFYGLFVFPLIIAVSMAVLLCTVVLLTREVETPESLITAIKTGSPSKRWQKAFELSNELNRDRGLIRAAGVMREIIHILNERGEYDAKTRSYMAMALSRFEDPEAVAALRRALKEEEDPGVQLYLIWALGTRQTREAAGEISEYLKSPDASIRSVTAYVLGVLEEPRIVAALEPLLGDAAADVRWNTALSLARLGSDKGYPILLSMMDRELLAAQGLEEPKIEEIMINAIKGVLLLEHRSEALPILSRLAEQDKSLKVRQAALAGLSGQTPTPAV